MILALALFSATIPPAHARPELPVAVAPGALSDGQVLAAISAMDQAEVDLAYYARQRSTNPGVKELAQMMIDHHSQNQAAIAERAASERTPLTESAEASTTKVTAGAALENLRAQNDATFDKAFVDMMVDRHQAALVAVDTYAASTRSAGMATFLANTRASLDAMLQHAVHEKDALATATKGT